MTDTTKKKITKEERQRKALQRQKDREKNKGVQDPSTFYCTNKALMAELVKWRASLEKAKKDAVEKYLEEHPGATEDDLEEVRRFVEKDPNSAKPSEELGRMMMHIATKLTNHSKFRNYSYDVRQDMISYALFKMVQGLPNFNFEFNNPFAYLTQASYNAFINVLSKYYKNQNIKKELMKSQLSQLECYGDINSSKIINSFIKDYLGLDESEDLD